MFSFFIAWCGLSEAQQYKIDSLQKKLIVTSADNQRMEILDKIGAYFYSTNIDSSILYRKRALAIALETKNTKVQIKLLAKIGATYYEQNSSDSAMFYFLKNLVLEENNHSQKQEANTLIGIGNIYFDQQNFDKSSSYFKQSLAIATQIKDTFSLISALSSLGSIYFEQNKDTAANTYFSLALHLSQITQNNYTLPILFGNLGSVCNDLKKYDEALGYYQNALAIYKKAANSDGIIVNTINIGNTYEGKGDYKQALLYDTLGLKMARNINNHEDILNSLFYTSEAYKGFGDLPKSYDYLKKYADYKDTVFQFSNAKSVADMQTKYETDKKQKENQLLLQKNKLQDLDLKQKSFFIRAVIIGCIFLILLIFIVYNRYRLKQKANEQLEIAYREIDTKNKIVEEKNKDITDSIYYARRIQRALLTSEKYLEKQLPDYFILYQPKDIVSGDFYWALNTENKFFIATADCTGHGVPGAFMSMLGINFLNEIVIEKKILEPNKIIGELRQNIIHALNPEDTQEESKDGMDMVLCAFDFKNKNLKLAASNNPVWIVRNVENSSPFLEEIKPDKFPVGKHDQDKIPFTAYETTLQKGDVVYTFTDGYADQFGGPKGKKFKYKQLKELVLANFSKPMSEQQKIITETLANWKGNLEQVDDILLIGIKV
ncbi:MAG: tetratricopeptide repeat protein [Bacteroidia bacterium]